MKTIVILAIPERAPARSFLEYAARQIQSSALAGLEFHVLAHPSVDLSPPDKSVQVFHYPGTSQTALLRHHLAVTAVDQVVRISPRTTFGDDVISGLLEAVAQHPEALVFYDWDEIGRTVLDGFRVDTYRNAWHQCDWTGGFQNPAFRSADESEYFYVPKVPTNITLKCCHPDLSDELEAIAACRFWFHPVRIDQRTSYSSKAFKHMLDGFLTHVEHEVFKDKTVRDLGCWDGGLGSQALEAGARFVHFTDTPMSELDRRFPYPSFGLPAADVMKRYPHWEMTVGEIHGTLPLVLKHRDPAKTRFSRISCYDLSALDTACDVTLLCGILYHVYDPIRIIQQACAMTTNTVIVGTDVLDGRDPVAYLQEPLESDAYDTTTWFHMSFPFLKMLFAHCGFERAAMLGGEIPYNSSWTSRSYRYMMFGRTFGAPDKPQL